MSCSGAITLPALHRACRDGDVNALSVLINFAPDRLDLFHRMCEYDSFLGWTPAHWASYHGKIECFRRLLRCGLNVDVGDGRYKRTPAHIAAFAGHPHMLLWILQAGADPNKQDDNGDTLVHHAARSGSNDCLQILYSYNSYMCLANKEGRMPIDIAVLSGFDHCAQYLSQFKAHNVPPVERKLKRTLDEDEIKQEAKRVCSGFAWPSAREDVQDNLKTQLINGERNIQANTTMHMTPLFNEHTDHDMEMQYENTEISHSPSKQSLSADATTKLCRMPSKLALPQRCMGSHYM